MNIYAGTSKGVFRVVDGSATQVLESSGVREVIQIGERLFAGTGAGLYVSDDKGSNWALTNLQEQAVWQIRDNGDGILYAGTAPTGLFRSEDGGSSWTRMKIGVMFGSPETTTGGNALKFYSTVRLDIRRIGALKDREDIVGNQTRVKVVKNKVAPPFKTVEFDILYGKGISKKGEIIDIGVEAGIIEKSGTWYSYEGERMGQGRENVKTFLEENPDISASIEIAVRESAGLKIDQALIKSKSISKPKKEQSDSSEGDIALSQ